MILLLLPAVQTIKHVLYLRPIPRVSNKHIADPHPDSRNGIPNNYPLIEEAYIVRPIRPRGNIRYTFAPSRAERILIAKEKQDAKTQAIHNEHFRKQDADMEPT
jgi:hypothetical protein